VTIKFDPALNGRARIEHAITRAPRKLNAFARLFNAAVKIDADAIGLRRYQKWQAKPVLRSRPSCFCTSPLMLGVSLVKLTARRYERHGSSDLLAGQPQCVLALN
jgi:hypothetical protein